MIRIGISHAAGPTEKNLELRGHVKALVVISFVGMLFFYSFPAVAAMELGFLSIICAATRVRHVDIALKEYGMVCLECGLFHLFPGSYVTRLVQIGLWFVIVYSKCRWIRQGVRGAMLMHIY